ncbi:leucyl aminopeptidase [Fodinicola feengrottensis]|uniref:Probable cytosol aminopeptidase n=2 Tax=Fodinicola feengrottensis TaxID=435914 RepID=A0ABP4UWA6_9ACTN
MTKLLVGTSADVDALAVGVYAGAVPAAGSEPADQPCGGRLCHLLEILGATGAPGEVTLVPADAASPVPLVVAVGLGDPPTEPETLRRAAGAAVRALAGRGRVGLSLLAASATAYDVQAVAEGALLGAYQFDRYRQPSARSRPVREVVLLVPGNHEPAVARASLLAAAVNQARDWVNTPPNDLDPGSFADLALATAEEAGLTGSVLDETDLADGGYGGIVAVGAGSTRPPRLVRLRWSGADPVRSIALIGKGITYDSGGLTLKSRDGLLEQKKDMVGAATVLATVTVAAALRLPLDITAYLPLAENMVGGASYRPGDILAMRNGLHVEVRNTDAEGRLVLADAVARACEDAPDQVLTVASLTGAQRIALGRRTAGAMGHHHVTDALAAAGRHAGEPIWPMPRPEEIAAQLESPVADLANWNPDTSGGMLRGAEFLSRFIPPSIPWAHLDIAGPSYNSGSPYGHIPTGATGTTIRALVHFLESQSNRH